MRIPAILGAMMSCLGKTFDQRSPLVTHVLFAPNAERMCIDVTMSDGRILHHFTVEGLNDIHAPAYIPREELLKLPQKGKGGNLVIEVNDGKLTARVEYFPADNKKTLRTSVHLTPLEYIDKGNRVGGFDKLIHKTHEDEFYPPVEVTPSVLAFAAKALAGGSAFLFTPKDQSNGVVLESAEPNADGILATTLFMPIKMDKGAKTTAYPAKPFMRRFRAPKEEPKSEVA